MSAVVLAYPTPEGPVYLKGSYWYPAEHAVEREITYQAPFRRWAEEGHLNLTPGGEIRYEDIRQYLHQLMGRYSVQTIAVDPWDTRSFVQGLLADGLPVAMHKQSMDLMGPATQEWQQLWVGGRLRCGGCPILRMCCNNAHVQTDINGNIRPVKGMSRRLIDALIAAMMAVHSWAIDQGTAPSMYEQGIGVG
jgi:phage terminase large subunit-like protein